MEFSRRLQNLRKEKGMIQENLAPELHISLEHLKKLEGGSRRASYELLVLYSIYFDVSIDYLLTGRDHLNKQTLDKLGHVNIFRGRVDDGFAVLDEKSHDQIFIRPHEIRLSLRRHQGDVPALIRSSRNLGFHTVVSLELENQESSSYVTADLDRTVWLQLREGAVNGTVYLNFAHFKFYSEQTKKFSDYELKTKWSYSI